MEYGLKEVSRAKEVLASRGMNVEINECVPGLESYQLVVKGIQVDKHEEVETAIETEFNVHAVMIIPDEDELDFLTGDDDGEL